MRLTLALLTLSAVLAHGHHDHDHHGHDLHYSRQEIDEAVSKKIIFYGSLLKLRNQQTSFL